jgi:hypothetical protein
MYGYIFLTTAMRVLWRGLQKVCFYKIWLKHFSYKPLERFSFAFPHTSVLLLVNGNIKLWAWCMLSVVNPTLGGWLFSSHVLYIHGGLSILKCMMLNNNTRFTWVSNLVCYTTNIESCDTSLVCWRVVVLCYTPLCAWCGLVLIVGMIMLIVYRIKKNSVNKKK